MEDTVTLAVPTTTTAAAAAVTSTSNPSTSILSEKVQRAVQLRTDTPALKAALEALGHLTTVSSNTNNTTVSNSSSSGSRSSSSDSHGNSVTNQNVHEKKNAITALVVDPRSVRTVMEQDALQQALALQEALQTIVEAVTSMRQQCTKVACTATKVRETLHRSVLATETVNTTLNLVNHMEGGGGDGGTGDSPQKSSTVNNSSVGASTNNDTIPDNIIRDEAQLAAILDEAFQRRNEAAQHLAAVQTFMETFDLSPDDSDLLDQYNFQDVFFHTSEQPDHQQHQGWAFLRALDRVRSIRVSLLQMQYNPSTSTSLSLSSTSVHSQSAIHVMESLATKQEGAYERLYHWLQQHLQQQPLQVDVESDNEWWQDDFFKAALYTLQQVPAFYQHAVEVAAAQRRAATTHHFLLALTEGWQGQPPLEVKAHDSVGYVGDMLAFAFQALSVEADLAQGLLNYQPHTKLDNTNNSDDKESSLDFEDALKHPVQEEYDSAYNDHIIISASGMLSIALSGLARPLKSRILQVISTLARREEKDSGTTDNSDHDEDDDDGDDDDDDNDFEEEGNVTRTRLMNLYDICGLLLFYTSAMDKSLQKLENDEQQENNLQASNSESHSSNALVECLLECLHEAATAYEATQRVYAAMLDQWSVLSGDSEAVLVHSMLVLIAEVRMKSPGFSQDVTVHNEYCQRILSVEWVTELMLGAAKCNALDDVIFLKKSLVAAKRAGLSIVVAEKLDEDIEAKETAIIDKLVDSETNQVLELCGLGVVVDTKKRWNAIQESEGTGTTVTMAMYPGLSAKEVEGAMKEFYASLYSPPIPTLETTVKDPASRKLARTKIASTVCDIYEDFYNAILSSSSGYNDTDFLAHTPEQVRNLFSI